MFWEYVGLPHGEGQNARPEIVASCYASESGGGQCISTLIIEELFYTISFDDEDIQTITAIRERAVRLVDSWRVRAD